MTKLIKCNRLYRPDATIAQITENRYDAKHAETQIGNPLFTAVVGIRRDASISLNKLVLRFAAINKRLPRRQMVHCLCVLGEGSYFWGRKPKGSSVAQIAKFMTADDLTEPLILLEAHPQLGESPFAALVARLYGHSTNSVLSDPTDIPSYYGVGQNYQACLGGAEFIPHVGGQW